MYSDVIIRLRVIAAMMKSCLEAARGQKFPRRNLLEKIRIGMDFAITKCEIDSHFAVYTVKHFAGINA